MSNGLLIAMVLKGLPPNFKLSTTAIPQKKTLSFSKFKVCLRSYEETECMCYPTPSDESNDILQMKTTFKKINPRNKPRVCIHSCYDYKSTNNYDNYQKPQHSREDYKNPTPPQERQIFFTFLGGRGHKAFECKNQRQRDFYHSIKTYSKGQTYFFALGYDIVSDKSNLSVNCRATNHVITDKLKFINFDQNFEPGNHFIELADGSQANHSAEKRWHLHLSTQQQRACVDVS